MVVQAAGMSGNEKPAQETDIDMFFNLVTFTQLVMAKCPPELFRQSQVCQHPESGLRSVHKILYKTASFGEHFFLEEIDG